MSSETSSSYKIQLSTDGTYIELKIRGNITRKLAMEQNRAAHALGRELGVQRYLVDVTEARNVDSVMETYNFSYGDMRTDPGVDRLAIVATLVSPEDHSHDFVETVSRNAGLNVTLFRDREQAVRYLTKKAEQK